eukprot:TRINITY_DN37_c0_g3_i1.p1 TRINITY_DN37_c0_g3~~TRINITY_DN37_c0_g3_i1.p1  ORF type:complete len:801 (+),score=188.34 TRINITY_DN37_c0_g3_i1:67-2403(+)
MPQYGGKSVSAVPSDVGGMPPFGFDEALAGSAFFGSAGIPTAASQFAPSAAAPFSIGTTTGQPQPCPPSIIFGNAPQVAPCAPPTQLPRVGAASSPQYSPPSGSFTFAAAAPPPPPPPAGSFTFTAARPPPPPQPSAAPPPPPPPAGSFTFTAARPPPPPQPSAAPPPPPPPAGSFTFTVAPPPPPPPPSAASPPPPPPADGVGRGQAVSPKTLSSRVTAAALSVSSTTRHAPSAGGGPCRAARMPPPPHAVKMFADMAAHVKNASYAPSAKESLPQQALLCSVRAERAIPVVSASENLSVILNEVSCMQMADRKVAEPKRKAAGERGREELQTWGSSSTLRSASRSPILEEKLEKVKEKEIAKEEKKEKKKKYEDAREDETHRRSYVGRGKGAVPESQVAKLKATVDFEEWRLQPFAPTPLPEVFFDHAPEPEPKQTPYSFADAPEAQEPLSTLRPELARVAAAGPERVYDEYRTLVRAEPKLIAEISATDYLRIVLACLAHAPRNGEGLCGIEAAGLVHVLSNIAELELDNAAHLRALLPLLLRVGLPGVAKHVAERILHLRPEEPQSYLDLAVLLASDTREDTTVLRRVIELLQQVVEHTWDSRFDQVEVPALMELNRVLSAVQARGLGAAIGTNVYLRLVAPIAVDLRVVLTWDADGTDVDLIITEPSGERCYSMHNQTRIGGLESRDFAGGFGPVEYLVRCAAVGNYAVAARLRHCSVPGGTVAANVTIYADFGRYDAQATVANRTVLLNEARPLAEFGTVTWNRSRLDTDQI